MSDPFLISDDQLRTLSATRQGRVSIAGYNYQAAYAVARLVSMLVRQPLLELQDWPVRLRYDWGEDLDEVCEDGTVRFTQCKRVATIGQAASLADVLIGFAGKWLWTLETERERLRFRLVCTDRHVAEDDKALASLKNDVRAHFLSRLKEPAGPNSDRAVWITDAGAAGHEVLFEGLWKHFDCLYLRPEVVDYEPAGPRLAAEKEALRVLLERNQIEGGSQINVLARLRRLIHDNLITFDPTNESLKLPFDRQPRRFDRADVNAAIDPWRPLPQRQPPFQLVDRTFLSEQRELERRQFVARQPDWCDVAHGYDEVIKFIERDQTHDLEGAAIEKVVAQIGRTGRLPALFVAGAPGDGKTTIVRRVAARLVDTGKVLIADTGVGLREPPGEPDEYVEAIERLQGFERPVLLLLDDPLYADSPWITLLKKLNRPGLRIGVLAASPQFLLDEHKQQLRMCDLSIFEMARTSQIERESLAAIYGRQVSSESEEDFLIAAMQAATGVPFSEVIDRLWLTLADGRDLSSARSLSDLPWQSRAYLFVCFFSRSYAACPERLLLKLLEMTGGVPGATDASTEMQRMRHFGGWHIFRISHRPKISWRQRVTGRAKSIWNHREPLVGAAHAVIAREAWKQRPLPWCDIAELIIEASTTVPEAIGEIANLAVRSHSASFAVPEKFKREHSDFLTRLIKRWRDDRELETKPLCSLVFMLSVLGSRSVNSFREELVRRSVPDAEGWLAMMRLWFLGVKTGGPLLPEAKVISVIQTADFSIDARNASHFGQLIEQDGRLWDAFIDRLLDALDEKLEWKLDGHLLTYLLAVAAPEQLSSRIDKFLSWFATQLDEVNARAQFMTFLLRLPSEFSDLRASFARQIARWLEEHPDDHHVRTKYIGFLGRLPAEHSELQSELFSLLVRAARQTAKWLEEHPDHHDVRMSYLSFLGLPTKHSELQYEFFGLRASAARETAKWLEEHPDDRNVRTKYLSFLGLPIKHLELQSEFLGLRASAARKTAKWIEEHPDDHHVRTTYLSFLGRLSAEYSNMRVNAARQAVEWVAKHPNDERLRTPLMSFLAILSKDLTYGDSTMSVAEWQELAAESLSDAARLTKQLRYPRRHQEFSEASRCLYIALLESLTMRDSAKVRKTLQMAHQVTAEWYARNPFAGLFNVSPLVSEKSSSEMGDGTGLES
jgi:hypothetical protein